MPRRDPHLLTASLACLLISVAVIVQLRTALKKMSYGLIRLPPHLYLTERDPGDGGGRSGFFMSGRIFGKYRNLLLAGRSVL